MAQQQAGGVAKRLERARRARIASMSSSTPSFPPNTVKLGIAAE